jgi:hypothetical protein
MRTKLLEVLQLSGKTPDAGFLNTLKGREYGPDQWRKMFEYLAPFIRWNSTPIFVDKLITMNSVINRVILAKGDMMRVEVPGGFITYENGEEIFTTPMQTLLGRDDIHYTQNHMVVRIPGERAWSLVEYSIDDENNMCVISNLDMLNNRTGSQNIVDVVSHAQHIVVLYRDRIFVHDWVNNKNNFTLPVDGDMVKIIPEFFDNGKIHRVILKDAERRHYRLINFTTGKIIRLDVQKSCVAVVPIFDRDLIWTVDVDAREACFHMATGQRMYESDQPLEFTVAQAAYIESVKRIVTISESGRARVGEISELGKYVQCGTLDYGQNQSFVITDMVTGPSGLALVGENVIRYISFQFFPDNEL